LRILIVSGEASGDLHGSGVVTAIKQREPSIEIFGVGGDLMQKAGCKLIYHIEQLSVMGFTEILRHLPLIRRVLRNLDNFLNSQRPDMVILIDYPDFNLRLARKIRKYDIPILYYISPQVWAWRARRIQTIVKLVDCIAVVFPFEVELYKKAGGKVFFVGHPILEVLKSQKTKSVFCDQAGLDPNRLIVGILPGSRIMEIKKMLPEMLDTLMEVKKGISEVQGIVGLAPTISYSDVAEYLKGKDDIPVVAYDTYEIMKHSDVLLVTSGTATLESAFFGTPLLVLYRMSRLSWFIAQRLVKIPYIGLVNVVAGTRIAPEFLQDEVKPSVIAPVVTELLMEPKKRSSMTKKLLQVKYKLGTPGASSRVAELALNILTSRVSKT